MKHAAFNHFSFSGGHCRMFEQGGFEVCDRFLDFLDANGGIEALGYPISRAQEITSEGNGLTYTMQYFEWARLEYHPENRPPRDILLSSLGSYLYKRRYPGAEGAPGQSPISVPGSEFLAETGKHLGGLFLDYWKSHGGLTLQGLPISDQFKEQSLIGSGERIVQYFERAIIGYYPEYGPAFHVFSYPIGRMYMTNSSYGTAPCDLSTTRYGKALPQNVETGHQVEVYAWGFSRPEPVWAIVLLPDGTTRPLKLMSKATSSYVSGSAPVLTYTPEAGSPRGLYIIIIEGQFSFHRSEIAMCVR
ncbi:MAG TPA: hypothetical protein VJ183_05290 [Chloroflexia bacterium]|nr:hypothetical protein [Chloroflexia bacterium]